MRGGLGGFRTGILGFRLQGLRVKERFDCQFLFHYPNNITSIYPIFYLLKGDYTA